MNAEKAAETEKTQSIAAIDTCIKSNVGHIIFSDLKTDFGDFVVPHVESKVAGKFSPHSSFNDRLPLLVHHFSRSVPRSCTFYGIVYLRKWWSLD